MYRLALHWGMHQWQRWQFVAVKKYKIIFFPVLFSPISPFLAKWPWPWFKPPVFLLRVCATSDSGQIHVLSLNIGSPTAYWQWHQRQSTGWDRPLVWLTTDLLVWWQLGKAEFLSSQLLSIYGDLCWHSGQKHLLFPKNWEIEYIKPKGLKLKNWVLEELEVTMVLTGGWI